MTKVYLFASSDGVDFQKSINEFIKDKKVIDIKYQALLIHDRGGECVNDRALVICEED